MPKLCSSRELRVNLDDPGMFRHATENSVTAIDLHQIARATRPEFELAKRRLGIRRPVLRLREKDYAAGEATPPRQQNRSAEFLTSPKEGRRKALMPHNCCAAILLGLVFSLTVLVFKRNAKTALVPNPCLT